MTTDELREKYLEFFIAKPRSHKQISPAPLVLENDPSTLFTSSGMQPLVPYLMGEVHPEGKRVVNSQPSIRVQDIEEVGDNRHTTYFEMLGNWSFGDPARNASQSDAGGYFKKEQLTWIWQFLKEELDLPQDKLYVSIFKGDQLIPRDNESFAIWKSLGLPEDHIYEYNVAKNWWSRSGPPDQMLAGEIGGPDSEVFFEFTQVKHNKNFGKKCHPNCDCGRFLEIGNSVFIQYKKLKDGSLAKLSQKNVDFGGGLERLVSAVNNDPDIFNIDVFSKTIHDIEKITSRTYANNKIPMRIVADHLRAANALAADGVVPANKLQGYIMRRLIRRAVIKFKVLKNDVDGKDFAQLTDSKDIITEVDKFNKTLNRGLREFEKLDSIDGKIAFDLYQTYGFPLEITLELAQEKGQELEVDQFKKAFKEHQNKSRSASAGKFKGGLADHSEEVTKLHTVTHLLHTSLRKVLGEHVEQKGSNITAERLRFDFVHPQKLTDREIDKVENLINEQIEKDLPVTFQTKTFNKAKEEGALAFFISKYAEKVKVYTIGEAEGEYFSKEVCGGPHIERTGKIGRVRINKQEKIGAGLVRIYIVIE